MRKELLKQSFKIEAYEDRPCLIRERREKRQRIRLYNYNLEKCLSKNVFEFMNK